MHQGFHILKGKKRGQSLGFLLALLLLAPGNLHAASLNKLMGMPAFTHLAQTIARVNKAMRSAAENPMDTFRRNDVRTAIAALPPAIAALAAEFQAGNLHNADLPIIQAMLGGFVDVNAADNYKKFMKNPDAALIPQVGSQMPAHLMKVPGSGSAAHIVFDDNAGKGTRSGGDATVGKDISNPELVSAGQISSTPEFSEKKASASTGTTVGASVSARLTYDDQIQPVQRALSAETAAVPGTLRDNTLAQTTSLSSVTRELLSVQANVEGSESSTSLESDFFKKEKPATDPQVYRMTPKPKYWQFGRIMHQAESLLVHSARAQDDCPECSGGGGGGGGGADAAGILMGLAAIVAAIVPAIVAHEQAEADKYISDNEKETQQMAIQETNKTARDANNKQFQASMKQAELAADTAKNNDKGVTTRLGMQLAALESAQQAAAEAEAQRLALENKNNQDRLALAEKQAEANEMIARESVRKQYEAIGLGLMDGTVASNSGSALSVNPNTGLFNNASTNADAIGTAGDLSNNPLAGSLGVTGARAFTDTDTSPSVANSQPIQAMSGGQRLLASIQPSSSRGMTSDPSFFQKESQQEELASESPSVSKTPRAIATKAASKGDSRLLAALRSRPQASLVSGSTRGVASSKPSSTPASGDLSSFLSTASVSEASFADFRRHQGAAVQSSAARGITGGHGSAYNVPR